MKLIVKKATATLIRAAIAMMVVVLALSTTSYSQVGTGTLTGRVTDQNGAVLPGSKVTATSATTGQIRETVTGSEGIFSLPSLPPSSYKIAVSKSGFQAQTTQLDIRIDQTLGQDFTLAVSSATATIEVQASDAAVLETESHEIAATLSSATLLLLPQTSRDIFSKLQTSPGVQSYGMSNANSDVDFFGTGGNSLSIGGTTNGNTSYLQDGVVNYNLLSKTANLQPTPEDVDQVNVQSNGASARYDEPSVVNVVTKGGSNQFHGQAYDYLQNDDLNAMGYYDTSKSQQRWNQFGVNAGGPILKNKLQFFFAYDGFRQHSGGTNQARVPTADMFSGNFTGIDPATNLPFPVIKDPNTGLPFAGNIIPNGRISSFAKAVIPYYPTPTGSYQNGTQNYSNSHGGSTNTNNSYLGRLDYNLRPQDSMYGAWETTSPLGTGISWIAPAIFNSQTVQDATNAYIQETHTFKPNLVSVVRFGYNHSNVFKRIAGAGAADYKTQFGVPLVTPSLTQEEPPTVSLSGYSGFGNAFDPDGATQRTFQYAGEVNHVVGKHSFFYGIEADHFNMNASWVIWNNGEFDFNGQYTGNTIADFLLGYPVTAYGGIGYTYGNFNQWEVMPYIQDDWKVNHRLTLNIGLRYDYYQSPTDSNGHAGTFILSTNSVKNGPYPQQYDTLAPRFGAAFSVNDKTVVRGGYGIYYSTFMYNELQFMLAHQPNYTLEINSFAVNNPTPIANTLTTPVAGQTSLGTYTTGATMPTGQVQQWNLAVQRSFGANWSASLAYLGNKAIHLQQRFNPNQASLPTDPLNPTPIQTRRPYPNVGDVYEAGNVGWANFNSMQAELVKRFSSGFSLNANYVWSKALDDQSEDNQNPRSGTNLALDYGPADFDRAQVLKISDVWELPIGPGKPIAKENNWFNRQVIGGWQTSESFQVLSSTPFDVWANDTSNTGGLHTVFADSSCSNPYAANKTHLNWLSKSCFTQPNGTLGNTGRNSLRGPVVAFLDASASKYFPITERVKVKFAADFVNALNHPDWQLGFASQNVNSQASLGQAGLLGGTRVIQLSLHAEF
jgi:outer membrane receptor protein involved in Fe transport